LTSWADALKSLTVVVSSKRAVSRDVVTSVGNRAPGSSSVERQASTAAIIGSAAGWNGDTGLS